MENQNTPNLEPEIKANGETKRKRKFNPESMWTKCRECKETGNLENMLWEKVAFTDSQGKVLYGCYEGVYFCGEECQAKFKLKKIELFNVEK